MARPHLSISNRLNHLQNTLATDQWLLLSHPSDIYYFSGFQSNVPENERSVFLLIGQRQAQLLLQNFLPFPQNFPGLVVQGHTSPHKLRDYLTTLSQQQNLRELQLDEQNLRVNEWQTLQALPQVQLSKLDRQHIWQLRQIKDHREQSQIRTARSLTKRILAATLAALRPGQTETAIAHSIKNQVLSIPGCDLAFPSIVAFDQHSAIPHHQPGQRKLRHGSVVLIDMGVKYRGYCADMTRTIWWVDPTSAVPLSHSLQRKHRQFRQLSSIVKKAYQAAAGLVKTPNVTAADLDQACRAIIAAAGYGQQFIHTTGHGLGLDIHEPPSLYQTNATPLQAGMIITIEPGIYLSGQFGVRYENTVVVK